MKNQKSSGPDGMVYEMIKSSELQTTHVLEMLYNKILEDEDIPFSSSWTTPIFKKGDRNNVSVVMVGGLDAQSPPCCLTIV